MSLRAAHHGCGRGDACPHRCASLWRANCGPPCIPYIWLACDWSGPGLPVIGASNEELIERCRKLAKAFERQDANGIWENRIEDDHA